MPTQPLVAEVSCRCTPVYVDMGGRVYIGREMERTPKIELPNTNTTGQSSTDKREQDISNIKAALAATTGLKSFPAGWVGPTVARIVSLGSRILLPVNIVLDVSRGFSVLRSIEANISASTAAYGGSRATVILMKYLSEANLAARAATAGRVALMAGRTGNVAAVLIGFVVTFFAFRFVSNYMLNRPDRSDRSHIAYDDFLTDPFNDDDDSTVHSFTDDHFVPYTMH